METTDGNQGSLRTLDWMMRTGCRLLHAASRLQATGGAPHYILLVHFTQKRCLVPAQLLLLLLLLSQHLLLGRPPCNSILPVMAEGGHRSTQTHDPLL